MAIEQVPDWPDALEAAAEQQGLGPMTCWQRADVRATNRVASFGLLVVGVITLVMGTGLAYNDQRLYGQWYNSAGVLGLGLAALVMGLVFTFKRGRAAWICLYEHGLAWQATGKQPLAMRWDEVDEVRRLAVTISVNYGKVTHHDTFVHGGGRVIPITRIFPAVLDLSDRVVAASAPLLLTAMAGRLDRGEAVSFDSVTLDGRGVSHEQQRVGWGDVAEVRVHKSYLQVLTLAQRKPQLSVNAVGLPNLAVLLTLADALVRAHRAPADRGGADYRLGGSGTAAPQV